MFAAPAEVFHYEDINVTMNEAVVNESQSVVGEVEEGSQVTKEEEGGMDEHWRHLMFCIDLRVVRTGSEFVCVRCKWVLDIQLYCVILNVIEINWIRH